MNSDRIRFPPCLVAIISCLMVMAGCRRSGDASRAAPEPAPPRTLSIAAPIDILGLAAREPMIVEHPDGTLFVSGYGASYVSGNKTDEPSLWKSDDGGKTWARIDVGAEAEEAAGIADPDLAVAAGGELFSLWTNLKEIWLARSLDQGSTWTTWRLAESPKLAYYPYPVASGRGELAATWFSGRPEVLQAHAARIDVGEGETPPRMIETEPFRPDSWQQGRGPDDPPVRSTAGEYLAVTFLRKGGMAVVSPIQNKRENRYGFSLWKVEEHLG